MTTSATATSTASGSDRAEGLEDGPCQQHCFYFVFNAEYILVTCVNHHRVEQGDQIPRSRIDSCDRNCIFVFPYHRSAMLILFVVLVLVIFQ